MYEESIFIPSGSLAVISFEITTGAILVVACFYRCTFAPDSVITSMLLIGVLGGILIQFNKIILGLLI